MSEYSDIVKSATDEGTRTTLMDAFSLCLTLHRDRVAAEEEIEQWQRQAEQEGAALRDQIVTLQNRIATGSEANQRQGRELTELSQKLATFDTVLHDREKFMREAAKWQQRVTVLSAHLINVERRYVPEALWTDPHPLRDDPTGEPRDDDLARSMQAVLRDKDQEQGR